MEHAPALSQQRRWGEGAKGPSCTARHEQKRRDACSAVLDLNSGSSHQPNEKEEHQSPEQGGNDVATKRFRMKSKARRKEPRNACTENAYDDVADEAKPVTLDKPASQPSCDSTDQDPGKDGFWGKH